MGTFLYQRNCSGFYFIFMFLFYVNNQQMSFIVSFLNRRCLCIYKDLKNFDRLSNLVQVVLNMGIRLIQCLPKVLEHKSKAAESESQQELSQSAKEEGNDTKQESKLWWFVDNR